MKLYSGNYVANLLNLAFVGGLTAVGASIGIRVHGGMLVDMFCGGFSQTPECARAIFLTNRVGVAAAILGLVLLTVAFSPLIMNELSDEEVVADGAD